VKAQVLLPTAVLKGMSDNKTRLGAAISICRYRCLSSVAAKLLVERGFLCGTYKVDEVVVRAEGCLVVGKYMHRPV
jgi:hypothetical protein